MKAGKQKQRGFTFWEISFYLLVAGFVVTCFMKLSSFYIDDHSIGTAIDGVHRGLAGKDIYEVTNGDIRSSMSKYFQVSMIDEGLLQQVKVERTNGKVLLKMDYEARTPFMGNMDIVMRFSHEVDLAEPPKDE